MLDLGLDRRKEKGERRPCPTQLSPKPVKVLPIASKPVPLPASTPALARMPRAQTGTGLTSLLVSIVASACKSAPSPGPSFPKNGLIGKKPPSE